MAGERFRFVPDPTASGGGSPQGGGGADDGDALVVGDAQLHRELLVNRLVEGRAAPGDWLDLRDTVASHPRVWEHLAGVQADAASLGALGALAECHAASAELPRGAGGSGAAGAAALASARAPRGGAGRSWRHLSGWAVAACLALALGVSQFGRVGGGLSGGGLPGGQPVMSAGLLGGGGPGGARPDGAGLFADGADPERALAEYVELGQQAGTVLGELPSRYVVQTRPTEDGSGTEVLYVRQILERAVVGETFRVGTDELGRRVLVPASVPMRPGTTAY